jgi:secondary thiamine-phosphate synthase enzyme
MLTREVNVKTEGGRSVVNVTRLVEDFVKESGVANGMVLVFLPHATAGFLLNEDEPNLRMDYSSFFEKLAPKEGEYMHNRIDDNADAHLLASLFKQFLVLPVIDGKLSRGTWQEIILLDFDGPRTRRITMVIMGE